MSALVAEMNGDDDEGLCWRTYLAAPTAAGRDALVGRYLSYARAIAASMYARRQGQSFEFDDYYQYAVLGLMECIDRYEPDRGASFKTYATTRMTGAILNGLEKLTEKQQQVALQRRMQAQKDRVDSLSDAPADGEESPEALFRRLATLGVGIALGVLLEGSGLIEPHDPDQPTGMTAYDHIELRQLQLRVREMVASLPEREARVIRSHYLQDVPFQDIALELGVTKGRVSQIHKRALELMREAVRRSRIDTALW